MKDTRNRPRRWLDENGARYEARNGKIYDRLKCRYINPVTKIEIALRLMNRDYERQANRQPRQKKVLK